MTVHKIQVCPLTTKTVIKMNVGDSTYTSHTFNEYEKNAIQTLYNEIKEIIKEMKVTHPDLKVSRSLTKKDIHAMNFKMETTYKNNIEEFKNIIEHLPFIHNENIELNQMKAFNAIANKYGRHGSHTYTDYSDVVGMMNRLREKKETLLNDNEGLVSITI